MKKKPAKSAPKVMTKGEFMKIISDCAIRYRREGIKASLVRNSHMHNFSAYSEFRQAMADAILVDFINYLGRYQGLDYGMYTKYLAWILMQHTCQYREVDQAKQIFICQNVKKMTKPGQPKCEQKGCPEWKEPT